MYLGRIVAAGMTAKGNVVAAYRVSSRSFPNRTASLTGETISIIPRKGFESDLAKNPYIASDLSRQRESLPPLTPMTIRSPFWIKSYFSSAFRI